jgi:O-methyltransferase
VTDPDLYIDLLKRGLTHSLYSADDMTFVQPRRPWDRLAYAVLRRRGIIPVLRRRDAERAEGRDWPVFAQTMIGEKRLENLRHCVEDVIKRRVPGDLIEAGVWAGGATILMRGILKAYGISDREVWVADSFQGLPAPNPDAYPADAGAEWHERDPLSVPLEEVKENFRRYGLLDEQVRFLPGWFKDTMPTVADQSWAVIRVDGDMYESTMDVLRNLYPRLSPGGYLIVDDYAIEPCRKAVDDFRQAEGVTEPIERIDWTGVFWRRAE